MRVRRLWHRPLILLPTLQVDYGDGGATAVFGFGRNALGQRMRRQKFRQAAAQRAGAVAVDDAYARGACERRLIEKFVYPTGSLLDRAADDVDFVCRRLLARLRMNGDSTTVAFAPMGGAMLVLSRAEWGLP